MEILALIDALEDVVESGVSVPFSGKSIIDGQEMLDLIEEIRLKMPDDLKQAKWVKEERQRILLEAQKEANHIIKEAESKIISLIDEHEITKKAYEQANEIVANAQKNAREIRLGTKEYADDILANLEKTIQNTLEVLHNNREELKK
ncbi:MAG: ATPase [Firmicutes bacterium]|nr:ATPase [Bacillota bacterium]